MNIPQKTLGEFIRETRVKKGCSLRELAGEAGITPTFLSDIERGKRNASKEVLTKIASALGIDLRQLEARDSNTALSHFKELLERNDDLCRAFISMVNALEKGRISVGSVTKRLSVTE
jgi:transcriptional regulator with XRE-family HTH domain